MPPPQHGGAARGRPAAPADDAAPTQEESLLHANLCLLGVPELGDAKGVALGRGMFRKPNSKALELILYNAYTSIRGKALAKKHFKGLWPIQEKKQQKDFYLRVHEWLKELKDAAVLDAVSATVTSSMRAANGPRLVAFLCDLTHVALEAEHARLCPGDGGGAGGAAGGAMLDADSRLMCELAQPMLDVARAQAQLHARGFAAEAAAAAAEEARMEAGAARLKEAYYSLAAQKARLEQALADQGLPLPDDAALQRDAAGFPAPRDPLALPLPPAAPAPPGLLAARDEAAALWARVDGHLARFSDVPGLVDGVVGSEVHPHAVDGARLRALAGLDSGGGAAADDGGAAGGGGGGGGSGEVDIVALLEGWVDRVEALEGRVAELDGGGPGGGPPTPLLATADARSHAPHLFAQLGVHRACQQGMRALEAALEDELAAVGARIRALRPRVAAAVSAAEQSPEYQMLFSEDPQLSAAVAAAAASLGAPSTPSGALPAPGRARSGEGAATLTPAAAAAQVAAAARPAALQLVPPTPILQQLAGRARQDALQLRQQPPLHEHEEEEEQQQQQQAAARPLAVAPEGLLSAAAAAAGGAGGPPPGGAAAGAPSPSPLAGDSPDLGPMEPLASPEFSDATEWLSSAKPRRLSYNAASTGGCSGAGSAGSGGAAVAAPLPPAAASTPAEHQTPAVALAPALGGAAAGAGSDQQALTLLALRARFTRATGAGGPKQ
ncbi:MAG: HAUS augmin-like complex subunit 6 N-terminus-domain-containing protein [Monoraphidium minutum]|nr:MAG: HAUS augmin-like complex subunit 6 N-terminus-domain-containing protein [Monoraphidium minutum]